MVERQSEELYRENNQGDSVCCVEVDIGRMKADKLEMTEMTVVSVQDCEG